MPYLTGPNKAESTPNIASAMKSSGTEPKTKPAAAIATAPNSTSFSHCATLALS